MEQSDPAAILDIKEDIREECEKLGEVTNLQLFDKEVSVSEVSRSMGNSTDILRQRCIG